jgi:MFS family permease
MPSMLEKPLTDSVIAHASFAQKNPSFFYQLFYTVYAWTNMAMSLVAGVMVDRIGLKISVFMFLSFCLIGSALFGLAFTLTSLTPDARYILMFIGRFIFGLGGGSITIAQNAITAYWFKNKELAMAFGCTLTISRIGSVVNFNLTHAIFNMFFSHSYSKAGQLPKTVTGMTMCVNSGHHNATEPTEITNACQAALGNTFWCGSALVGLSFFAAIYWLAMHTLEQKRMEEDEDGIMSSLLETASINSGDEAEKQQQQKKKKKKMQLSDVALMPITYWLVVFVICIFYCIVFPYMSIAPQYLSDAKLNGKDGGHYASLVYLMSAIISPFLGRAVDYFGRRGYLAVLSTSLTLPVFLLLQYTDVNVSIPMVLLGLSYCGCAATLWPTIQMLVDEKVVGTANGIATCVQMLGIGLCNLMVGYLMDSHKSKTGKINYNPTLIFFTTLAALAVSFTILLKCCDTVKGGKLYKGQRDKKNDDDNNDDDSLYDKGDGMMSPSTAVGNLMSPNAGVAAVSSHRRNV